MKWQVFVPEPNHNQMTILLVDNQKEETSCLIGKA
jgi:hypothetical protein